MCCQVRIFYSVWAVQRVATSQWRHPSQTARGGGDGGINSAHANQAGHIFFSEGTDTAAGRLSCRVCWRWAEGCGAWPGLSGR